MQGLARVPRLQWLPGCGAALNGLLEDRGERLHKSVRHLIDRHRATELDAEGGHALVGDAARHDQVEVSADRARR